MDVSKLKVGKRYICRLSGRKMVVVKKEFVKYDPEYVQKNGGPNGFWAISAIWFDKESKAVVNSGVFNHQLRRSIFGL